MQRVFAEGPQPGPPCLGPSFNHGCDHRDRAASWRFYRNFEHSSSGFAAPQRDDFIILKSDRTPGDAGAAVGRQNRQIRRACADFLRGPRDQYYRQLYRAARLFECHAAFSESKRWAFRRRIF